MAKLQKFLFDTDFNSPRVTTTVEMALVVDDSVDDAPDEDIVAPPPPPTFSEEELGLAREQAFDAGREAGRQDAETALQQMLGMAMASCAHHLQAVGATQQAANDTQEQGAIAVALAVLRKLHPEFCRRFGVMEIEAAVKDSLGHLDHVARITVKVHPDLVLLVREKTESLLQQAAFDGKLIVSADPQLPLGDCRLDWGDGGAERLESRTWAEIDRVVEDLLGSLPASIPEA